MEIACLRNGCLDGVNMAFHERVGASRTHVRVGDGLRRELALVLHHFGLVLVIFFGML